LAPLNLRTSSADAPNRFGASRRLLEWAAVALLLLLLGKSLNLEHAFSRRLILVWFALTPVALRLVDYYRERLVDGEHSSNRHLIIGANEVGSELAKGIDKSAFIG
jgi:putative colanic acid biosysnthesis UDP-glucose lipid carrier transferase